MKIKTILLAILTFIPVSVLAHADDLSETNGHMIKMNGSMMSGWWSWTGWTFMILFWLLIVLGIVALIKWIIKK